jgi:hypothetical protein
LAAVTTIYITGVDADIGGRYQETKMRMFPLIVIAALVAVAGVINSNSPSSTTPVDHSKTVVNENSRLLICRNKETLDRVIDLAVANDLEAFTQFTQRQKLLGECKNLPPHGTKVRVDDSTFMGLVCITPFGSTEPCQWTAKEAVK